MHGYKFKFTYTQTHRKIRNTIRADFVYIWRFSLVLLIRLLFTIHKCLIFIATMQNERFTCNSDRKKLIFSYKVDLLRFEIGSLARRCNIIIGRVFK
jgi:hypothetical protein